MDWRKSLVVLDVMPQDLNETDLRKLTQAHWYEAHDESTGHRIILVPYRASGGIGETDPLDAGIDIKSENVTITRIDNCLKRWNEVDGFYHA